MKGRAGNAQLDRLLIGGRPPVGQLRVYGIRIVVEHPRQGSVDELRRHVQASGHQQITVSAIRAVQRQVARHQERSVGISHHHDALVLRLEVIDHAAQEFHAYIDLRLQQLGVVPEAAPDLTKPDAGVPALTLVFDREGWSPDLFKRLARRGIACITWHKNFKGEDWPEEDFRTLEVLIHGPAGTSATTVDLAEQPIVLRNGLTVRQIRRRLANGRQVPVITTHPQMPLVQVAGAMFSRWSQENFFKYMREQFNLDSLPSHDLEPLDPDAQVVNPVRRALEKTIRRVRSRLATARNRLAEALQEHHRDTATRLEADANSLAAELDQLKQQRADSLTHVRAGDLPEQDKLDALPVGGRLFLDLVRMIAYRAETRMMVPVITTQGKKPNARRLLRALLTSDANIIPQPAKGILRIQLLGLGSDACDRMLAPLVEELNATRTIYPGTDLTLVYELAGDPPPAVSPDSG